MGNRSLARLSVILVNVSAVRSPIHISGAAPPRYRFHVQFSLDQRVKAICRPVELSVAIEHSPNS